MLKIDIISGFLGAGKTTFIKRLLKTRIADEKVVLIENEFGEISIDTDFLSDSHIDIKEISQGCICCSLAGDFSKSLHEVISKFDPDRIIIEPSGVGKLSDVKKAIIDAGLADNLNSLVCIVDSIRAKLYLKNFGEFFIDQIASASTVILSRTDIAKVTNIHDSFEVIRQINADCVIISTPVAELNDDELLSSYEGNKDDLLASLLAEVNADCSRTERHHHHEEGCCCGEEHHHHHEEGCCCGEEHHHHHDEGCCCGEEHHHHHDEDECCCGEEHHHHHDEDECCCGEEHHHHHEEGCCSSEEHHHHHHAEEVFQSIGLETIKVFDVKVLNGVLNDLANSDKYGSVVRGKGIVKTTDGWKMFNLSPNESSIAETNAVSTGKVCIIGLNLDKDEISSLFR